MAPVKPAGQRYTYTVYSLDEGYAVNVSKMQVCGLPEGKKWGNLQRVTILLLCRAHRGRLTTGNIAGRFPVAQNDQGLADLIMTESSVSRHPATMLLPSFGCGGAF